MPLLFLIIFSFLFPLSSIHAQTFKSREFTIQTGPEIHITPTPTLTPIPTPFQTQIKPDDTPFRLTLSSDLIDFGPLTATNPVKRELSISIDAGTTRHLLLAGEN